MPCQITMQSAGIQASLVVLTGFRATGKTVVGMELAKQLDYTFVDTDDCITQRLGCSISSSVQQEGWQTFRALEQQILVQCLDMHNTVIATGGGAICHTKQWNTLRNHALVVWLKANEDTILRRLQADHKTKNQRPSLNGQRQVTEITDLLPEREILYREGSDLTIHTAGKSPEQLANRIAEHLHRIGQK